MITYVGYRLMMGCCDPAEAIFRHCVVRVREEDGTERPLLPRFDLRKHDPTGFDWGYGGSGAAQLALALAADCLGDDGRAFTIYQKLKRSVVARLPADGWTLEHGDLYALIEMLEDG